MVLEPVALDGDPLLIALFEQVLRREGFLVCPPGEARVTLWVGTAGAQLRRDGRVIHELPRPFSAAALADALSSRPARRPVRWAAFFLPFAACAGDPLDGITIVGSDPPDAPIDGLDGAWMARFADGDARFEAPFVTGNGLGPTYARASCVSCHADDARGPGVVTRFTAVDAEGAPTGEVFPHGDMARPLVAGGATIGVLPPDRADVRVTVRLPQAVFGRGYLEAVHDDELLRVQAEQSARGDAITGRISRVRWPLVLPADGRFSDHAPGDEGLIGRFGLKARTATLDAFAAEALLGDMAITSPYLPSELPNPEGLADDALPGVDVDVEATALLADYVRLLAIPARETVPGSQVFAAVGCDACHVPALRTAEDWPIAPLAGIDAPIYTDLLLHDLGTLHDDALPEGAAEPSEWRTAPLIGLRFQRALLHDGRAATVEEAILGHEGPGSEANDVIAAFHDLSPRDRAVLIAFVSSL